VDGQLVPRGTRVSLTFRQALLPGSLPSSSLTSSEIEKDHVFRVYDNIAVHWNHTRSVCIYLYVYIYFYICMDIYMNLRRIMCSGYMIV
jgi:hypothetical protein